MESHHIEVPIRSFIKNFLSTYYKAEWTFYRHQSDETHGKRNETKDWKTFKSFWQKTRSSRGSSLKSNKQWAFRIKAVDALLPTLIKRKRDQGTLYNTTTCQKCKSEEETFEHLTNCPADKNI